MCAAVQTVLQQTMGRVEAELAGLDADVIECDKAAARLHRELAKAREKWAPPGGTPADPQWDSAVTDQPETTTATAVISRRTNGAHLPSMEGVKPSEIPEGFLYEAVDVPEQALVGRKAGKSQVSPGEVLCVCSMQICRLETPACEHAACPGCMDQFRAWRFNLVMQRHGKACLCAALAAKQSSASS